MTAEDIYLKTKKLIRSSGSSDPFEIAKYLGIMVRTSSIEKKTFVAKSFIRGNGLPSRRFS